MTTCKALFNDCNVWSLWLCDDNIIQCLSMSFVMVCCVTCCINSRGILNDLSHCPHILLCGWREWFSRLSAELNIRSHSGQLNGRVCLIRWNLKLALLTNFWLQMSHMNGFSPVWSRMWFSRPFLLLNVLLQYSQINSCLGVGTSPSFFAVFLVKLCGATEDWTGQSEKVIG